MSKLMNEIKRAAVGDGKYAGLPSHVYSLFGDALAKLDEVAALEARLSKMEEAAEFRGHKGGADSPCGGVGKCSICDALAGESEEA